MLVFRGGTCRSFFTPKVRRFGSASLRFTYEPAVIRTAFLDRRLSVFFGVFFFCRWWLHVFVICSAREFGDDKHI